MTTVEELIEISPAATARVIGIAVADIAKVNGMDWPSAGGLVKGYYFGGLGSSSTFKADVDVLTLATEVAASGVADSFPSGRFSADQAYGSSVNGYHAGGNTGSLDTVVFAWAASTDTRSTLGDSLSVTKSQGAGFGDGVNGYQIAGKNIANADKHVYPTDAISATASADLTRGDRDLAGAHADSVRGYVLGGFSQQRALEKLAYPTDAMTSVGGTALLLSRRAPCGLSNEIKVYVIGGVSNRGTAESVTVATDAVAAVADGLVIGRDQPGGLSDPALKGWIVGGDTSGGITATTEGLTFATEAFALVSDADRSVAVRVCACTAVGAN